MRQRINKNLILIALLAVLASVISITYIYYGMFQERVRSDLEVCIELLKDTHYLESPDIDPEAIDLKTDIRDLRVTWISDVSQTDGKELPTIGVNELTGDVEKFDEIGRAHV